MKLGCFSALLFCAALLLSGCGSQKTPEPALPAQTTKFTRESRIEDVKNDPVFAPYGRLLFPVQGGCCSPCRAPTIAATRWKPFS